MKYSTWDWHQRAFRVYEDSRPYALMSDAPRCPHGQSYLGMVDVNAAICPLPSDARFVGTSAVAVGRVVRSAGNVQAQGRSPGLGGAVPIMLPHGGMGYAPAANEGLGLTFGQAVFFNVLVAVLSGVISTGIFKAAFRAASAGK